MNHATIVPTTVHGLRLPRLSMREDAYIDMIGAKAVVKYDKQLSRIAKSLEKNTQKKYQVLGWKMLKQLRTMFPDLLYTTSDTICTNKLTGIHPGYKSGCCNECDGRMSFASTKVPVLYVYRPS